MNFEDMQKVWDTQNQTAMYVINEEALHKRILKKKNKSQRLANLTEYIFIFSTLLAGSIIVYSIVVDGSTNVVKYFMAAFFYMISIFLLTQRKNRTKEEQNFEETMLGDLDHAISNATHQVRLSKTMMNIVFPFVCLLAVIGEWITEGFNWEIIAICCFFAFTYFAARWEHSVYDCRKRELLKMKEKVSEEVQ